MVTDATDFLVRRDDLEDRRLVTGTSVESVPITDGQTLLRVDRFALTANNVTYAVLGETMGYWKLFPAPLPWGRIPAWGIGTVIRSACQSVPVAARYYGLFPMSTHAILEPGRIRERNFVDAAPTRRDVHPLYNGYTLVTPAFARDAAAEALALLLRPLFITSFVLDDLLANETLGEVRTIVLSSASSKTAYGLAFLLARRKRAATRPIAIVGLTSAANVLFAQSLGLYDRIVTYDAVGTLPNDEPVAFVDFSGNLATRGMVHRRLGEMLEASYAVGYTHVDRLERGSQNRIPGPQTQVFFSPDEIAKRVRAWGPGIFEERFGVELESFVDAIRTAGTRWLRILDRRGAEALERAFVAVLAGRTKPDEGYVLSL